MNFEKIQNGLGAVVIGRNEGRRLVACLESLVKSMGFIVYVDSGSSDDSVERAESLGVHVLCLDLSIPFTAARARNEGANYLIQNKPNLDYIQFVDGDCIIYSDWPKKANDFMNGNIDYAIVCGRRRERYPENSIYNQLCDIEWDTSVGDALACGGDALIRVSAFQQVDGYDEGLIAGEEPEMCFRLRIKKWKIRRIDADMTLHDAAIVRFGQWWNRAKRAGYAYASSCYLHGLTVEVFKLKDVLSIVFWATCIPLLIALLAVYNPIFVVLLLVYPLQVLKVAWLNRHKKLGFRVTLFHAASIVIAKWPQFLGVVKFGFNTLFGRSGRLIEYK
jgi:glycosyltransferase involved in cell wall biosynthesis